jgi:hypothetical protein
LSEGKITDSRAATKRTKLYWWLRLIGSLVLLVLAGSAASWFADSCAQRRWLLSFGADPDAHPYVFFATRIHDGMTPKQVTGVMPHPTRVDHYVVQVADGDSALLERYVYRLVTSDWPVDVYYDQRAQVFDFYAGDNPGLGQSPRPLSAREASMWGGAKR